MRLLFIGDIVGKPGRKMVEKWVPLLRKKYQLEYVIANYENSAHGFGITLKIYYQLSPFIDIWTGGNHTFDKKEVLPLLEEEKLLRPLNYYDMPGKWYWEDEKLVVINAMGQYGLPCGKNPFRKLNREVEKWKEKFIFIDFHGEATSEKQMLFHLLKGRVGAIIGTHTHIGTDDLQIEEGTCYLTDVGLTGCNDGMIGFDWKKALPGYLTGTRSKLEIDDKCKSIFQGVILEWNGTQTCWALKVKGDSHTLHETQLVRG
jgi:metallophosphoesterase (TIGR00282 family)